MPSVKPVRAPRPPIRQRGRDRVAAIMDAAALVFAERGYEATTMSEIAVKSRTAVGSLYRFFPGKEQIADALYDRYEHTILEALDRLEAGAAGADTHALTGRLFEIILAGDSGRDAALAVAVARTSGETNRSRSRAEIRDRIAALLVTAGVEHARAAVMAPLVLRLAKLAPALAHDGMEGDVAIGEVKGLLAVYIQQAR